MLIKIIYGRPSVIHIFELEIITIYFVKISVGYIIVQDIKNST